MNVELIPIYRSGVLKVAQNKHVERFVKEHPVGQRLSSRFVAGDTIDQGIAVARDLRKQNLRVTLDYLGEAVTSYDESVQATTMYFQVVNAIANAHFNDTGMNVDTAVKPTQLALGLGQQSCYDHLTSIAGYAHQRGTRVWIDMESSAYTDATLAMYHQLLMDGYENVGVAIQAYLPRSSEDLETFKPLRPLRRAIFRVCKGAYCEPKGVAYAKKNDTDTHYEHMMDTIMHSGHAIAIATHDQRMIDAALRLIEKYKLTAADYEFQMLYGVKPELQRQLANLGYPVRIYVPFGDAWYPYLSRRLAETPYNLLFIAKNSIDIRRPTSLNGLRILH